MEYQVGLYLLLCLASVDICVIYGILLVSSDSDQIEIKIIVGFESFCSSLFVWK